ncbi:hypothetical protein ACTHTE_10795 [Neisseria sp. P0016.S009]
MFKNKLKLVVNIEKRKIIFKKYAFINIIPYQTNSLKNKNPKTTKQLNQKSQKKKNFKQQK